MAERMAASFRNAPHFYLHVEADMRATAALRQKLQEKLEKKFGIHLTYTDILIRFCALTLAQHPEMMAQWSEQGLIQPAGVHIGIAMDAPNGLIVPVIHEADQLGLVEISRKRQELSERAREGKLLPQDLELGVFTISNLGMFGIDSFDAIINPPQAAILATGRIKERALVIGGAVVAAPVMNLSLSVDHRVLDGAKAARFLGELVELIETPELAQA
jgi:pyruvate dehydrogenase E2 component (dihydrolipoamide acetyltransferase)